MSVQASLLPIPDGLVCPVNNHDAMDGHEDHNGSSDHEEPHVKKHRRGRYRSPRKDDEKTEMAIDPLRHKKVWKVLNSLLVLPDTFEEVRHFYPRALNAHLHPMVGAFQRLGNLRIASRYCHLNPKVDEKWLLSVLKSGSRVFKWSGADLFNVANSAGNRQMIIIETNSCPSGQKAMPLPIDSEDNADGYHKLIKHTFFPHVQEHESAGTLPVGDLAVIFDKNDMEASGYAAALADISHEKVHLAKFDADDPDPPVKWENGVMQVRSADGPTWIPIRAAFRYVTQRPWSRIPLSSKTLIMNPIVACLAGGRNKMAADKAYEFFNKEIVDSGLEIRVPETIRDVNMDEVPLWVKSMGGKAVVKIPYSNAGEGVYTIINDEELRRFMAIDNLYDKFIVQALVGHGAWSSTTRKGTYYHTGTIPNAKNNTFVADLRMMICSTANGFMPLAVYARQAAMPLVADIRDARDSWGMLGTNLSIKKEDGSWDTETNRLLLMDTKDFNRLGLGTDDLIDAMGEEAVRPGVAGGHSKRRQLAPPRVFASKSAVAPVCSDGPPSKIRPLSWAAPSSSDQAIDPKWNHQIGARVCIGGAKTGILLYYGHTKFAEGVFCGVKLDEPLGKHDGSVQGQRYFTCPPGHGIFAPPHKVVFMSEEMTIASHPDDHWKLLNDPFTAEDLAASLGRSVTPDLVPSCKKSPERSLLPRRDQNKPSAGAEDRGQGGLSHYSLSGIRPPKSRTKLHDQLAPGVLNATITLDDMPNEEVKDDPLPSDPLHSGNVQQNAEPEFHESVCDETFVPASPLSKFLPDVTENNQSPLSVDSPLNSDVTFTIEGDGQLVSSPQDELGLANGKPPSVSGCCAIQEQLEDDGSGLDEAAGGRQWSVELDESLGILSPDQMKDFTVPTETTLAQTPSDEGIQEIVDDEVVDYVGDEENGISVYQAADALHELSDKIQSDAEFGDCVVGLEHPGSVELWKQFCSPYLNVDKFITDESFPKVASSSSGSNITPSAQRMSQLSEQDNFVQKACKLSFSDQVFVRDKIKVNEKTYSQESAGSELLNASSTPVLNLKSLESGISDTDLLDKCSSENTRIECHLVATSLHSSGSSTDSGSRNRVETIQAMDKILSDKFISLNESVRSFAKDNFSKDLGGQPIIEVAKAVDVAHLQELTTLSACVDSPKSSSFEIVTSPKPLFGSPTMTSFRLESSTPKTPPLLRDTQSVVAKIELQLKRQDIFVEKGQAPREETVSQLTSDGAVEYLMQQMGGNFVQTVTDGASTMAVSVTSIDTGYQGDAECDMQSDGGTNAANTPIEDSSKEFNAIAASDVGKQLKGDAGSDSDFCSDMAASWTESDLELDDRARGRGARIIDGRLYFSSSGKEVTVSTESLADDIRKASSDSPKIVNNRQDENTLRASLDGQKPLEPALPAPENCNRPVLVITPESPASDDTLRCRDSVVSADSTSGGETSLKGNAISEEGLDQMFDPVGVDGRYSCEPEPIRAGIEEAPVSTDNYVESLLPHQNGKINVPLEGPPADKRLKDKVVNGVSSKTIKSKGKTKPPTPPKKEAPPKKETPPKDKRKAADFGKKSEKESSKEVIKKPKTPKKNVMSKIKAMIEGASSKLSSSKDSGGSPNSSVDKEDAKKATRLPKKSRWDAVMSKIAAGQAEEKTKTKKEVASRVYSNLTPSKPSALAKSPQVGRNALRKKEAHVEKASLSKPTKHSSAKAEAVPTVNCKPRLKSLGTSSEATDLSINSHSERSTSQLMSKKSKLHVPVKGARPCSLPFVQKGGSTHSVSSQPSLASTGSRGSTLSQLTLASHSSARPTKDYSLVSAGSNLSAPTDRSRTGKPSASSGRRSPMTLPVAPAIPRRSMAPPPVRGLRMSQRSADQSAQLRSLKSSSGLVRSGPHPDLLHSSVSRSGAAREVSRLEALCEARTKELNFARMQLKHCAAGFDSLAVLVQYLTHEVGAFSVPELSVQLLHMQEKLKVTHTELEEARIEQQCLQDEIAKLHHSHQNQLERREKEAQENLALAEHQSKQNHQETIETLKSCHENHLAELTNKHVDQLTNLKKLHEEQEKLWLDEHLDEITNVKEQYLKEQTDFIRIHEEQVYDLKVKHLDSEAALEQQIQQLTTQCEDLEKQHSVMQETFLSENSDHRLQAYVTRCTSLGKEVDSLKVVLDMRLKELQDLRREKQEAEQQADELTLAREEIKKLIAKTEDLQAQIVSKTTSERYLLLENESLKESCEKKLEQSKRISMENEALHWRLRQSKEFSITLNPIEGSGDSSNGAAGSSLSYYWDNEGLGATFSPIKAPAGSRPMSHPKSSSPHGSPRLSPSKARQPSSAPGRPVSAPVYPKDNSVSARLPGLSTSEDETQLDWEPQVSIKLREKPKRKLVRHGSYSGASAVQSGSPPSASQGKQNGHLAMPLRSSTPWNHDSIKQLKKLESNGENWNADLKTAVHDLINTLQDVDNYAKPSCIGQADSEHELPFLEGEMLDVQDSVFVDDTMEQQSAPSSDSGERRENQVTSTDNIELDLSKSKTEAEPLNSRDDSQARQEENIAALRYVSLPETSEMQVGTPVLDIVASIPCKGTAESVNDAPQRHVIFEQVIDQVENNAEIANDADSTEIDVEKDLTRMEDLLAADVGIANDNTLSEDVLCGETTDQTEALLRSIPMVDTEHPILEAEQKSAFTDNNTVEAQENAAYDQKIAKIEAHPLADHSAPVHLPSEELAALLESRCVPSPTEYSGLVVENGGIEFGLDSLEINDGVQTYESESHVEIEVLDLGAKGGYSTPQTSSANGQGISENGDEDASRTSSSEELLDSTSLESSLSAVVGKGSLADEVSYSRATTSNGSSAPSPKKTTTLVITFRANRLSVSSSRSSSPVHQPGTPSASEASESQSVDSSPRASPINEERITNKAIQLLENSLFAGMRSPRTSAGEAMILDELPATPPPQIVDPTHVLLKKALQDQLLFGNGGSCSSSFRGSLESCAREASIDDSPLPGLSKPDTPESTSQAVVPTDSTNIDMSWSDDDMPSETEV